MKISINRIKQLIAGGDIEIAINDFTKELPKIDKNIRPEKYNEIEKITIGINAQYKAFMNKERLGVLTFEDLKLTYNQILIRFIDLLNQVNELINSSEVILNSENILKNLIYISPEKATNLAINEIKNGQSMKVVGIGRQNFAEDGNTNNHVLRYYETIEKKLKEDSSTERPFYIKRVTQHILKDKFRNHLEKCFNVIENSNNKYEIVFYGDLKISYTYYIINSIEEGNAILFLTLNTEDTDFDLIDNTLAFYTRENSIIDKYNRHFDQFWKSDRAKNGRIIKNLYDFKRYVPFDKSLYKKYNEIKQYIKRVPNDSVRIKHLKNEMKYFHNRLKGLNECRLKYTHSNQNQRVSDCFTDYMDDLKNGKKSYKTLSVKKFWEALYDMPDFLEKQEVALQQNAEIERIYLVDSNGLDFLKENKTEGLAIIHNYSQSQKYPNYRFHILFSTDDREFSRRENYAIWEDKEIGYKVLFSFNFKANYKGTTELIFANYNNPNYNDIMSDNQLFIESYENRFEQAQKIVINQNKDLLKYIQDKKKTDLNIEDENYEKQLNFLRRNGITSIEDFLKV